MSCCRSGPCEQMFSPRAARRSLERYRSKGLDEIERRIVASAKEGGIQDAHVLEIGGGIGAIQAELLEAGAATGEIVELVSAYEPYARALASDKGFAGRVTFRVADLVEDPDAVEPADVVVLNRVVCCSPDGVELSGVAARLARRTILLSSPRDVPWVRLGIGLINLGQWLFRRSFRAFVHPPAKLRAAIEEQGLRATDLGHTAFWEYTTLQRAR
ncbi:MAG TPA: class I SAM-dependent methyltransferase [Gaiellaceae bacterium]|nr:class I SAM-dependent methyltransferase [Gaiellaceae bacterium]